MKLDTATNLFGDALALAQAAGRRLQLEAVFREHEDYLRRLARLLCRSMFDPEDLLQDVLERTVQHCCHVRVSDPRAWMARVMRNLFVDRVRRQAASLPQVALESEIPTPAADPRAWWEGLSLDDVRAHLPELSDELRVPFELFTFEGRSYDEIARRLEVPRSTVGTRILRARRQLRRLLIARHRAAGPAGALIRR